MAFTIELIFQPVSEITKYNLHLNLCQYFFHGRQASQGLISAGGGYLDMALKIFIFFLTYFLKNGTLNNGVMMCIIQRCEE